MSRLLAGPDLLVGVFYLNRVGFLPPVTKEGTGALQRDAGQPNCRSGVTAARRGPSDISTVTQPAREDGLMPSLSDHQGNGRRAGAAWTEQPERTVDLSPEPSRVRRFPVACALSGSNHILKGLLTRNAGMKKYAAPVPPASVFHGWFCMLHVLTDYRD